MRAGTTRVRVVALVAMAALALTTAACADNSSPSTNTPGDNLRGSIAAEGDDSGGGQHLGTNIGTILIGYTVPF